MGSENHRLQIGSEAGGIVDSSQQAGPQRWTRGRDPRRHNWRYWHCSGSDRFHRWNLARFHTRIGGAYSDSSGQGTRKWKRQGFAGEFGYRWEDQRNPEGSRDHYPSSSEGVLRPEVLTEESDSILSFVGAPGRSC